MALLGQALGQTSLGSKLWALAPHLNAKGYTKHPPQSSAKVPGARRREFFSGNGVWSACVPGPERGLSGGGRYVGTAGWVEVCGSTPGSPSSVRSAEQVQCSLLEMWSFQKMCIFPWASWACLRLAKDVGTSLEGKLLWDSSGTSWIDILLLDWLIPKSNTFLFFLSQALSVLWLAQPCLQCRTCFSWCMW